jgi:hypothetical protein
VAVRPLFLVPLCTARVVACTSTHHVRKVGNVDACVHWQHVLHDDTPLTKGKLALHILDAHHFKSH